MTKKKVYFFTSAFVFLFVLLSAVPCIKVLSICNRKNPSEKYYINKQYLEGFKISYTHSVNKGRVHDFYTFLSDDSLLLDKTRFVSYGAGIPEPEETPGAVFTVLNDGYVISNLQRKVPKLTMAVGIIANHGITFDCNKNHHQFTKDYVMTDLFAPQTSIILEIKRVSLFDYIHTKQLNLKGV